MRELNIIYMFIKKETNERNLAARSRSPSFVATCDLKRCCHLSLVLLLLGLTFQSAPLLAVQLLLLLVGVLRDGRGAWM